MPNQQQNSKTPVDARDSWRTPPWLFEWLDERFYFHIDLAADSHNRLCSQYLKEGNGDGLSVDWHELPQATKGFCNPPYSNIDPWVAKAIAEQAKGFLTVMLFPTCNGEDRYAKVFERASEIIDIIGRVAFLRPDGTPVSGNTRGSSVYVFDPLLRGAPCRRWWVMRDAIRNQWGKS